ncbi:MAG: hypothetical protein JOZ10_07425 [Acidobacteria bacterium]|nr:hypothetical protein [Acidobacteriota bacterium]MBV9144963.1 hypothetical protein [Acidobacteriota bacterium]MBV9435739.1 hypothetical protein [Acidobacteriota bacterium]
MQWLGPEIASKFEGSRWPVLLSVCPNLDRMQSREDALHAAGYHVASASTLTAAKEMSQLCKFDIVLLDHECASEEDATNIQERHVSVLLEPGTTERQLLAHLSQLLQVASASAAVQ